MRDEHDFLHEDNIKVSYQLILLFLLVIARYTQSTKNKKFVISVQYPKKKGKGWSWFFACSFSSLNMNPQAINLMKKTLGMVWCGKDIPYRTIIYHTKRFNPWIHCLCNISLLLLFQVTVGPCKLVCFDLVGPFLQSAFRPCYLECRCNRFYLENYLGSDVSPHLHPWIIVGELSHVVIFYFIIWFVKASRKSHQTSLLHFSAPNRNYYMILVWVSISYVWQRSPMQIGCTENCEAHRRVQMCNAGGVHRRNPETITFLGFLRP